MALLWSLCAALEGQRGWEILLRLLARDSAPIGELTPNWNKVVMAICTGAPGVEGALRAEGDCCTW